MDLDAGTAACAAQAGQEVAGDVVTADRAVGGVDPGEVLSGGVAGAGQPCLQGAVGDDQARVVGSSAGTGGAGEVVQTGHKTAPGGDRRSDEVGEGVELAGDGLMTLDALGAVLAEIDSA